jgi:hypothetical protein
MTKKQAIQIFGRFARSGLCRVMNYSCSYVSEWPDVLDERRINEVVGAAIRNGYSVPKEFLKK